MSVQDTMLQFMCGNKTQIQDTSTQKQESLNELLQGSRQIKRKTKVTGNGEINVVLVHQYKIKECSNFRANDP